jgi:thymidylate synthase
MVNTWNVSDLDKVILPPYHYSFQVYTRELTLDERLMWMKQNSKVILPNRDPYIDFSIDELFRPYGVPKRAISLMFNMRSNDVLLGLPFNVASYALLLEIIARMVSMVPDELIVNLGESYIDINKIEEIKKEINTETYPLSELEINDNVNFDGSIDDMLNSCDVDSFTIN